MRTPIKKAIKKTNSRLVLLLLALSPLLISSYAQAEIQEFKLSNGMKVIVQEDHRAPVVVSQVWYRAGSLDEVNGKTGVAHVLEHMMFKGTKRVPAGQFSRIVAAAGGKENAFTGTDYTCYYQQLEKSHLPLSFKLESDRMTNLVITDEEFAKEIKVVMEERRWRTEDKPQSKVNEQFQSTSFNAHPYARPVVGWMNDLENMTAADAREWYNTWYAPNNATLVVVGDVKTQDVLKLAKQYFGAIKPKVLPARKPQTEPAQIGERRVVVKAPGKLPYLMMGFHAPTLHSSTESKPTTAEQAWEPYALDVLSGVLSGNDSARLNQKLVRETSIAVDVGTGYDTTSRGREALFELVGTPAEGKTVAELEAALVAQIELIKSNGVTQQELDRVKAAVIAADIYQRDSMFYQGMQIGQLETMGYSWRLLKEYPERLKAITSEQIQAVAKKYLVKDNMTIATLDPQPIDPNAKPVGKPHIH
ncbi:MULTISPECIES: M16 family metallopeptidase [Methylotenera]|uniref:M16 family metallopeptidase n=1 Tax=Methylotenera TaxID=359407 RepID=UPI0003739A54|nr:MULTISPECIES: pitrilysin family protein [Methylotenera]